MNSHYNLIFILGLLVAYRIFKRVRQNIGWQQLKTNRIRVITVIFFIIGALFLLAGLGNPSILISDTIGIIFGVILAYYGYKLTNFENRNGHWYFYTNIWISSTVTLLFLGRLFYRIYDLYSLEKSGGFQGEQGFSNNLQTMSTSWSAGLFLIMFAYYIAFNLLILQKQKKASPN